MNWKRVVLGGLVSLLLASNGSAQHTPTRAFDCPLSWTTCAPEWTRVDPQFKLLRRVIQTHGVHSGFFGPDAPSASLQARVTPQADGLGATLRVRAPLDAFQIQLLTQAGVRLLGDPTGHPSVGWVHRVWVPWEAVEVLERLPGLMRAEVAWRPLLLAPVIRTSEEIGALAAHRLPEVGVTGQGVVVADIDSGIDVLHPSFFRADGGLFDWVDVNDNGVFEPGFDAIDYNRDGQASASETARVLDGTLIPDFASEGVVNRDNLLNPRLDWLYADQNQDFQRNVGVDAGFVESDPGYGEPTFVVDDVDGDGLLGVGERVALLGSSKILKFISGEREYLRGVDLIESASTNAVDESFHGTSVSGILLGGQRGYHARVGVAPDAELIMYNNYDTQGPSSGWEDDLQVRFVQDAQRSGAHMVLHEWTSPFTSPMDGSSNLEAAMDIAHAQGVAQINPLGNLNRAQKHLSAPLTSGEDASLEFVVGPGFSIGANLYAYTIVYTSLQWRSAQTPSVILISPDGQELSIDLSASAQQMLALPGGVSVAVTYERTLRGTSLMRLNVYNEDNKTALAPGRWAIRLEDVVEDDVVYARVSDLYSSWGVGVRWSAPTRDATTLSFPSTADSAIGVAAYGGRSEMLDDGTSVGQLRGYSGRGPRVDGQRAVDIAGPDDPHAPLAFTPRATASGWGRSWYGPFGGTSGAGPHVAGALALSIEAAPERALAEHEDALFQSARRQDLVPAWTGDLQQDLAWGEGKLAVFDMLYGSPQPANEPPELAWSIQVQQDALVVDMSASTDPEGQPLQARVDADYDGAFDTAWGAMVQRVELLQDPQSPFFKVQIRDAQGLTRAALIPYNDVPAPPVVDDATPDMPDEPQDMSVPSPGDTMSPDDSSGCFGCAQTPGRPDAGWMFGFFGLLALWGSARLTSRRARP